MVTCRRFARGGLFLTLLLLDASRLQAQSEPAAGVRAAGMAGAFTAVADDASAIFWNPAGLATASYFSLVLDRRALQTGVDSGPGQRGSALLFAGGMPPLGLSYRRTRQTRVSGTLPIALQPDSRNTNGTLAALDSLVTHQLGVTLLHSLGTGLAVGATLKLVRGVAASEVMDAPASLAAGGELAGRATHKFDADLGIMKSGNAARVGLAVHNAFQPEFMTPGGAPLRLQRTVRGGISLNLARKWTLAGDADLTKADVPEGRWRDAAIGVEGHPARRMWVRGGTHWNTAAGDSAGGAAPVVSLGGSLLAYGAVMIDGQVTVGSRNGDRGWGIGARLVFF